MVRTPRGLLLARDFSSGPGGHRIVQKQALQFWQHLVDRFLTEQQLDDPTFERMKTDRMIDLGWMLSLGRGLPQLGLRRLNQDGLSLLLKKIVEYKSCRVASTDKPVKFSKSSRLLTRP